MLQYIMGLIEITKNDFLTRMETADTVLVKEIDEGLQVSFGDTNRWYLIETDEYVPHQFEIFEMVKDLEDLEEFEYTSKFTSELYYDSLLVNPNLETLLLSHMENIEDVKQLGNIKNLCLGTFKVAWLNLLPKTLEMIEISELELENAEDYNMIVHYFESNNIDYYVDDYSGWVPDLEL